MASPSSPPQPRVSCAQAVAGDEPPRDRGQVPSATDNQPRSMERDYDFVERPSQDFFCPVSLELLLEPQLTYCCGHHLSRDAATRLQREGKACPMCNGQEWNAVLDKYHRRKVREVRVRCPHKGSGCVWVGEVNGLTRHADSCAKRPWECKYCGLKCTYGEGEGKHWPTCLKFPEPCPNGCEVGSVERCNVEQHRSVCSLEPVACEMKEFGCSAVVPRKELATHMRESELQHLTAMAVLNLRLSRQLQQDSTERDRKITRLQQDMAEQKKMQNETKQLQNEMKMKMAEQKQMQVEMKKEMGEQKQEITGLKEGQKHEGSQVRDAIAALSQQVEREKETMTELQTKTREEMKEVTKQLQTEMKTKMDEQKKMQTEMKTKMDEQKKMQTEMKAKMDEQKQMQTEMKTKMDEQKKMQTEMKAKMDEQKQMQTEMKTKMDEQKKMQTEMKAKMDEQKQMQTEMKTKMDEQKKMQTEMKAKMDEQKQMQTEMKTKMDEQKKMQTEIKAKMDEQKQMQAEMKAKMDEQKQMQAEMKAKMDDQKKMQTKMNTKMDEQKREVVELKAQVQAVQHTTQHIEEHTAVTCTVCKVFTFTNYIECKSCSSHVYSDPFYSHHHGYKFKLRIRYYGSSHNDIGASLCLVNGEYDDQLHWPVEVKVRLELLNQAGDHHHVERTKSFKWEKNKSNYYNDIDINLMKYPALEKKGDGVQYMMNDSLKFRLHLTALPA